MKELTDDLILMKKRHIGLREHWLTVIQLLVCLVLLITALTIKYVGGEVYQNAVGWYDYYANSSILTGDTMDGIEQKVIDFLLPENFG